MRQNPIISLLTVLALVVAMLYPLPLHCCQTLSRAGSTLAAAQGEECHMHRAASRPAEPKRAGGCDHCTPYDPLSGEAGKSEPAGDRSVQNRIGTLDVAACHCATVGHASIDQAVLASSGLEFHPPVVAAIPPRLLVLLPRLVGEPVFKIGSSPPFMADKSHHTYLHTASLLI